MDPLESHIDFGSLLTDCLGDLILIGCMSIPPLGTLTYACMNVQRYHSEAHSHWFTEKWFYNCAYVVNSCFSSCLAWHSDPLYAIKIRFYLLICA